MTALVLCLLPLARNDVLTDLGQFGGVVALLMIGAPLSILCWAMPLAKSENWTPQRRKLFVTCAFIVSFVPVVMCAYAMLFRCTDPMKPGTDMMVAPEYVTALIEVIAAMAFVSAGRGIRLIAVASVVIPLVATFFVGFVAICLIGGDGP
jgi:hypothetical protein